MDEKAIPNTVPGKTSTSWSDISVSESSCSNTVIRSLDGSHFINRTEFFIKKIGSSHFYLTENCFLLSKFLIHMNPDSTAILKWVIDHVKAKTLFTIQNSLMLYELPVIYILLSGIYLTKWHFKKFEAMSNKRFFQVFQQEFFDSKNWCIENDRLYPDDVNCIVLDARYCYIGHVKNMCSACAMFISEIDYESVFSITRLDKFFDEARNGISNIIWTLQNANNLYCTVCFKPTFHFIWNESFQLVTDGEAYNPYFYNCSTLAPKFALLDDLKLQINRANTKWSNVREGQLIIYDRPEDEHHLTYIEDQMLFEYAQVNNMSLQQKYNDGGDA